MAEKKNDPIVAADPMDLEFAKKYEDCYVTLDNGILTIGNHVIERTWNVKDNIPTVLSLENKKTGKQWINSTDNGDWLESPKEKYAFYKKGITEGTRKELLITAGTDDDCGIGRMHLQVAVDLEYEHFFVKWIHMIYPDTPVLRSMLQVTKKKEECLPETNVEVQGTLFFSEELSDDFHHYAECYPDYWVGQWTFADSIESTLSNREGLYHFWVPDAFWPYCAHAHAWMLYCYYRRERQAHESEA